MGEHTQIIIAPGRYVQGRNAIYEIGEHVSLLGDRVLVIGGKRGLAVTREGRNKSFTEKEIFQVEELFRGEVCNSEIERLTGIAKQHNCNVLVACGGGKAIDAAKAVANNLKIPSVMR
ncbi:Glycerol dehydrogenase [Pelotomaculum schinkii]|uniref:Glycerol dehydrogenase n=2 Tax=Pelotomaculum schinkii TaxID=78350 RepID=A0A4Y7R9U0_9FIRM|nr:Glycerol dehydrogenase [Pelotomaculum schinkii]